MIIKRTILTHFIILSIFSLISCGDDDACPDIDQFNFESSAIYNCGFTTDSNAFKQALMGSYRWDYYQDGWRPGVDCAIKKGNRVEFKANNMVSFKGSHEVNLPWQSIEFSDGSIHGWVKGVAPYSTVFHLCGSKLLFLEPGLADGNRDVFSKE